MKNEMIVFVLVLNKYNLSMKKSAKLYYKIYKIKDLIASNGPLITRGINKRRLKRDKTE